MTGKIIDQVIWSKDRPMQLDLLLRSFLKFAWHKMPGTTYVLYSYSADEYGGGYNIVKDRFSSINHIVFIREEKFDRNLKSILRESTAEFVLGNSDDNVFINPLVSPPVWEGCNVVAFSLRLHPGVTYCQPAGLCIKKPYMYGTDVRAWKWEACNRLGCWGYPHACDSNVYRREYWYDLIKKARFKSPAPMEIYMDEHRDGAPPYMLCFNKPVLINICNNRVQDTVNECGSITAQRLNGLWLEGKQINLESLIGLTANQCHVIKEYDYEDRAGRQRICAHQESDVLLWI
jgi:hypothetical protein